MIDISAKRISFSLSLIIIIVGITKSQNIDKFQKIESRSLIKETESIEKPNTPSIVISYIRHAARTSKKDTLFLEEYPAFGKARLIPLGLRQSFLSGIHFQRRYPHFFHQNFTLENIRARSTATSRTIKSARSHVLGILYSIHRQSENKNNKFEAPEIFIRNRPLHKDPVLRMTQNRHCNEYLDDRYLPVTKKIHRFLYKSPKIRLLSKKINKILEESNTNQKHNKTYKKIKNLEQLSIIYDQMAAHFLNHREPFFTEDNHMFEKMEKVRAARHLSEFLDDDYRRILLSGWGANFQKRYLGKNTKGYRTGYFLEATHDKFLTPLLLELGRVDWQCCMVEALMLKELDCECGLPQYSSRLSFFIDSNRGTISADYDDKIFNPCSALKKGKLKKLKVKKNQKRNSSNQQESKQQRSLNSKECKLKKFLKIIDSKVDWNWKKTCESSMMTRLLSELMEEVKEEPVQFSIFTILAISFSVYITLLLCIYKKYRKFKQDFGAMGVKE